MEKIDPNPNWEPGDIALCIRGGKVAPITYYPTDGFPVTGCFYTVESVRDSFPFVGGSFTALFLKDGPRNQETRVWAAYRFIKVTPPPSMEEDSDTVPLTQKEKKFEKIT